MSELETLLQVFWDKMNLVVGGIVGIGVIALIVSGYRARIEKKRLEIEIEILRIVKKINEKVR